jgi:predicted RNase H-like nuclease (RuvC/YqgF family)
VSDSLTSGLLILAGTALSSFVTWLTTRNGNKTQRDTVLAQIEQGPAERAAKIYDGAINQLASENGQLRTRLAAIEAELERCKTACSRLARRIDPRATITDDGLPDVGENGTLH